MAVYVDTITVYPNAWGPFKRGSCHMAADTLSELHALAASIGLRREWLQKPGTRPHYDLTPSKRAKAISAGAVECSTIEIVRIARKSASGAEV